MATTIQYTDKLKTVDLPNPPEEKFQAADANEIKTVVNNNASELDSVNTLANSTLNTVVALDGSNLELIKGGGVFIDTAIVDLQAEDSQINSRIDLTNVQVLNNATTKIEIGGDIGGTITVPTINSQAITNNKLANIPTNRIKGRASSGNGVVEDLTVPQTKQMLSIDNIDNTSDLNKPISTAVAAALNTLDFDLAALDSAKISKNVGTTYTTNGLTTLTQAEFDGLTPDSTTLYFIV